MQEDFQTSRATFVHLNRAKCPFTSGHIRPYHNMRSRTSLDPDTFGSTSVGTSAGSVKPGGTYSAMDEQSFVRFKTGLRGGDVMSNTGVETFTNTFNNYPVNFGGDGRYPVYNRPMNNSYNGVESFAANPVMFT